MALSINNNLFEPIENVKRMRNIGVSQEVAEAQAQEIEKAISSAVEQLRNDVATKRDIYELKIELKNAEIKLMMLIGGGFLAVLGMLAKALHWF